MAALALLAMAGGAALLYAHEPSQAGFFPKCRFHEMTGLDCPGCGATRATHHLLHGRIGSAFYFNALYVAALPVLAAWGAWWLRHWWTSRPLSPRARRWNIALSALALAALIFFSIARNLPWWPWL